jgi:hypothetical protein
LYITSQKSGGIGHIITYRQEHTRFVTAKNYSRIEKGVGGEEGGGGRGRKRGTVAQQETANFVIRKIQETSLVKARETKTRARRR